MLGKYVSPNRHSKKILGDTNMLLDCHGEVMDGLWRDMDDSAILLKNL